MSGEVLLNEIWQVASNSPVTDTPRQDISLAVNLKSCAARYRSASMYSFRNDQYRLGCESLIKSLR